LGGRRLEVAYTPGHASHHVSYFDAHSGSAFVGDTAGVRLGSPHVLPPTPPPDVDVPAWGASVDRITAWKPSRLFLTHFAGVNEPEAHLETLSTRLAFYKDVACRVLEEPGDDETRARRFVEMASADMRRMMSEDELRRYQMVMPLEHCWLGLARYCRKHPAR
jgi:glyoxylase-like metal-dependent hydrolase (beta-lactamase superfamily II)